MAERAQITITGIVQGVGFRPYVYSLAADLGIRGHVANTAQGVLIEAEGERLPEFLERLPLEAPPLSRIAEIKVLPLPLQGFTTFAIHASTDVDTAFTLLSPDVSICPDCLRELLDPSDRRYLYPFINCTNCGPRYSITRRVPYDRPNTTMAVFNLCPECEREYHDPRNRRFHAQPNACPKCGPGIEFRVRMAIGYTGSEFGVQGSEALNQCVQMLKNGGIVAVKGISGFHIACDASNDDAVKRLRERKRRSNKPFAVMASSIPEITSFCDLNREEQALLESRQRPIVLVRKKEGVTSALAEAVSPKNNYIGCMLPYTPLHYLLFHPQNGSVKPSFRALVMTSGNLSEEPIVRNNDEALQKLADIVDGFLLHDRDIFMRVDDSVVRVTSDKRRATRAASDSSLVPRHSSLSFIRRSRGYAPEPITLHEDGPEVLGCGADLKNTFTLTKGSYAIPSQHIGDMENYETLRFFDEVLANLKQIYRAEPVAIAHDLHPGYLSTQWAKERLGTPKFGIQHHYAHIGSVMAEHGLKGPVIGVALDGTGYGTDGNLWGGEFLIAEIDGFRRVGQFNYVPLPGGEAAIREPWRTAACLVAESAGSAAGSLLHKMGFTGRYGSRALEQVIKVAKLGEVSPLSSGAGRLFDAISALIGCCDRNTFEGEAAMALESLVVEGIDEAYPVVCDEKSQYTVVDFSVTISAIIEDVLGNAGNALIATKFHNTVLQVIESMARAIRERTSITDVALSGGAFQNQYLLRKLNDRLSAGGMIVFINHVMPPNDACISLGQAYLVRERLKKFGVTSAECGI